MPKGVMKKKIFFFSWILIKTVIELGAVELRLLAMRSKNQLKLIFFFEYIWFSLGCLMFESFSQKNSSRCFLQRKQIEAETACSESRSSESSTSERSSFEYMLRSYIWLIFAKYMLSRTAKAAVLCFYVFRSSRYTPPPKQINNNQHF